MATIGRSPADALDNLAEERGQRLREMLPGVQQAQELMRQLDSVRPLIEALRRNEDLMRQAAEALTFNAPALELAKELTAAREAMKEALRVDTSTLDIGKTLAGQMDTVAALKSVLQIDTSALDAMKNVTLASDAIRSALHVDTSGFSAATKALSMQAEMAPTMKAAL